jgi:hypothetical protein
MSSYEDSELRMIRQSIERRGIDSIYHYTYAENLPYIFRHRGILCRKERQRLCVAPVVDDCQRWGSSTRATEMSEYVACALEPPYGMLETDIQAGSKLALCEIDAKLIYTQGTLFCPAWSSHRKFDLQYLKSHCTATDFDNMFPNPSSSEPRFFGAEILVKNKVPLSDIKQVYFVDKESRNEATKSCTQVIQEVGRIGVTIYFVIRPEVFKRPPDHYLKRARFPRNNN